MRGAMVPLALGGALVALTGCKAPAPDTPVEPDGAEVATGQPAEEIPPVTGPAEIWAWVGLTIDRGEATTTLPDFVRIVDPGEGVDRDALLEHYGAQLAGRGWTHEGSKTDEAFRNEIYVREDLRLTLAANDEQEGGAGLGATLAQNWPALDLPRAGAVDILEEPARLTVNYPGETSPEVLFGDYGARLALQGWDLDRTENGAAPMADGPVMVAWYGKDIRALRFETYATQDDRTRVGIQVGWK